MTLKWSPALALFVLGWIAFSPLGAARTGDFMVNGDFTDGLSGWESVGSVFSSGGSAGLSDDGFQRSLLFQGVPLEAGNYFLSFDFRNLLSPTEPLGFARDSLFASLFVSSTPAEFDPVAFTGFDVAIPLLDLDAMLFHAWIGEVNSSPSGANFLRYKTPFSLVDPGMVFVVFDLYNLNGIFADSLLLVDNVTLIPEPGFSGLAFAVFALAFATYSWRRKAWKDERGF